MRKAETVKEVSKSTGIEASTVQAVVEGFMEGVKGHLQRRTMYISADSEHLR